MKKILFILQFLMLSIASYAQPQGTFGIDVAFRGGLVSAERFMAPFYTDTPASGRVRVQGSIIRVRKAVGDTLNYIYRTGKWVRLLDTRDSSALSNKNDTAYIVHRIIIDGQSNATGQGNMNTLNSNFFIPSWNWFDSSFQVYIQDTFGNINKLQLGVNNMPMGYNNFPNVSYFGPEIGVAYRWRQSHPQGGILLIEKYGIPGSAIQSLIYPPYIDRIKRIRDTADARARRNRNWHIVNDGFIWVQGEANVNQTTFVQYYTWLDSMVKMHRNRNLIDTDTRIVFSRMPHNGTASGWSSHVDSAHILYAATSPYYTAQNNDAWTLADNLHYNNWEYINVAANYYKNIFSADSLKLDTTSYNHGIAGTIPLASSVLNSTGVIYSNSSIKDDGIGHSAWGTAVDASYNIKTSGTVNFNAIVSNIALTVGTGGNTMTLSNTGSFRDINTTGAATLRLQNSGFPTQIVGAFTASAGVTFSNINQVLATTPDNGQIVTRLSSGGGITRINKCFTQSSQTTSSSGTANSAVIAIPTGGRLRITADVRGSDGTNEVSGIKHATIKNNGGVLSIVGSVVDMAATQTDAALIGASFTIAISGTNALVQITGILATNITWLTTYEYTLD